MRKQSWVEESGASRGNGSFVRHAKVFGIKTMATVMTASMILSGVPVQAIAEGIQTDDTFVESNVESSQGDTAATANDASSGQASDQGTTENNSAVQDDAADSGQNTQTSQAVSQDKATTADIALALNNASITYQGQVIAQPSQKVTAPASVDFKFSVTADNGFKLNEAKLTVDGVETKLKADANGEYTVPAAEVAKSPKVTLETEQEKQAETTGDATPIEQNATDTNAVAVQAATDADYTVEVGDSITLKATGASNSGWWSFSDWSIISQTTSGNKAELATRGVGRVTATYTYQDSRWQNQTKTFVVDIIDRKDATTPGIEGPSSVVVDSEFELTETKNASEWEWHLIGDGDYTAARIDSGAGTKKIKLTALYQFAGDGKVVTVQCKYKVPGTNNTVYSDTFNVTIRKRQWKVADWTYVDGTYKAIPTIVDVETNEPVKEWQTGFQVTYYINGEDKGCNPWSGDFFDPNKTYEVKIAPFGDQGWNSKYSGEAKTFDDPVPVKDRTPIASDSPSNVDYEGQEHKWAPTATDKNTRETLDDTEYDVIYKRDGKETGDFTSPGKITVEIKGKHHHKGEIEKTYTIREKQIKLSVSGPDTVEQFNTIQLTPTLEPAQKGGTYTWTSNNENILTVDKNGKVTGVSEGKATVTVMWTSADGKTVLTADHDVTVTHTTSGKTDAMFFYLNDPSGQLDSTNTGNWQTLGKGKINLTGYNNSNFPKDNGATKKYDAQARVTKWPGGSTSSKLDVKRGSNDWNKIVKMYQSVIKSQLPNVEVKDSDIESIELLPYKLTRNNDGYHVDCQVVVKCKGLYTVKYWVDDPTASGEGYQQVAVTTTAREGDSTNISDFNQSYPETKTVNGVEYTFSGWFLDAALTKSASLPYVVRNSNLNFYAKYVAGRMVMYDLQGGSWKSGAGTTYKVNAGKTHTVLTEPKREGYEFEGWKVSGLGDQISVNSGDMFTMPDNNVTITAQWKKKSATVTVNYLWGDKDSHELIERDKLAGDYSFDDVIDVAGLAKDFDGYTIKPSKSTKRVLDAGENVINIYYYKNVTLTAKSAGKTYNGEQQALEGYTTSEGAAKFDDITAKGSGTNAGEYKVAFNEGAQGAVSKDAKYIVSETVSGKLTITPVTDKVTITVKGHKGDKKYNGKEQTVEGYDIDASTSPAGVAKSDVKYGGTASVSKTDAGKYAMGLKDTQFSLSGDAAKNYTNVKFKVVDGELNIAQKDVRLKSADLSKEYDGTALTNNGAALEIEGGFVEGEGATYTFSGSQTTVGSSANAFTYVLNSNTKAENYIFTKTEGKLEVTDRSQKYEIRVTANSGTRTYTGNKHSVSGLTGTTFTNRKGATFTVEGLTASVSGTDAGEYTNKVSGTAVVKDAQGNDVTSQFNVTTVDGKLVINKRNVTIKPKDASKVYDGNALVATDWEVAEGSFVKDQGIASPKYTGSQTAPGISESKISEWDYKDGTNSKNYNIRAVPGTLNVTSRGVTQTITVEAGSTEATYDGEEHSAKGLKTNEFELDGKKYTVSGLETSSPTKTDAGTYDNNITGTAKVTDAQGNDVTSEFKVETKNGTLTIAKADVTIVPKDASKPYDGQPLTATDFTATGFIGNDTVTSVVYGGSQTEAGTSTSSITSYEAAKGTNLGNYNITKGSGTLEVTASQKAVVVKVKGNIDTKKYDGIEKNISGFTVTDVTVDGQESKLYGAAAGTDFTFSGTATAARTDVGTTNMGLAADQFANVNKNFANVTFEVVEDGSVTVTPREVTLTSATDEKPYDGTPLTKPEVAGWQQAGDTGFVTGEVSNVRATGSVTTVAEGEVTNTIGYDTNANFKKGNYSITKKEGKLSITSLSAEDGLTIKPKNAEYTYDADSHTAGKASASASVNGIKVNLEYRVKGSADSEWRADPSQITAINAGTLTVEVRASADNYSGYQYAEQTLTINKRDVELTSASASKVYDGTALTKDWVDMGPNRKGTGFIGTDLAGDGQVHATGSQTEVGSSDNTISYQLKKGKENNYNIMDNKLGTLEVTAQSIVPDPENPDSYKGITISDPSDHVYDGKAHKWTPTVRDAEGNELTEGTDYTVSYDTDDFTNAKTIKVTIAGAGNYTGTVTKKYKITPAPLTVNAKSGSKVYDGTPLIAGGTIEGLVDGETATAQTEGSQTEVGSSDNKVAGIEWGTADEGNYRVVTKNDGTLTVTAKSIVPDPGDENNKMTVGTLGDLVYNGKGQEQKPEVRDGEKALAEGTDYTVSFSEDTKNVGTVTVTVTGKGNYAGTVERTYRITPATLTVNTPSDFKVYDGKALRAEGSITGFVNGEAADFRTTGSQTKVGSSTNTYSIDWAAKESTAKKSNYTVSENLGTLTVTETADEIVATPGSYKGVYDGQAHGVDVTVTGLPEDYSVKAATSSATVTDVNEGKPVAAKVDDLVIVNAQGEDVTNNLKITKGKGSIEITPATLTVTTPSASKAYDGTALTAEGKVSGFVNGETAPFTTTGSQTKVGKSSNGYTLDWNDTAKESNYTVEEDLGTLEVTKNMAAVMVIPNGGSKVYDGKVLESDGVTTYGLPSGYTLEAKTKGSVTNVGSATAEVESYTIKNAAGKDVTDQFGNVATGKATLEVTKRPVTVTSATDSKVYDGSPLTKHDASVTAGSLAKDENFTYEFTGEQTVVGSTANSFTVKAGENTDLDNYKTIKADGTLTVTAKSIVPDPSDEHNKMSVDAPASVKYDGNAHKWIPTVKDGDKTLKEGADYTVSYSKDDFTNVTGVITVTITGKGNYAGTVTRTYEITKRSVKLTGVKNVTKVYDGTALEAKDVTVTGDGFVKDEVTDIKATGSVTEVTAKPVENPIEFTAGKGFKEGNYTIEKDPGTLQVTARSIDDATYGMSVSKPESVEYDGQAHKWAPTVKDGEKTLAEGTDYTVAYGKDDFTNVTGEIKVTVTGKGNYAGSVERAYQITPAPLTVETKGATKVYDGEALTHDVATIKGLKNKETATIHATGSQTEVGESDNGYAITWDGSAQKDNYTIKTKTIGKLVVSETADQITATPVNAETTYDGSAHGTTVQVTGLPKGYTVKKAESKATATDVADGEVKATVDELVIVNAQGKDVTSKLNIKRGTATIKINPAPLTVTTDGGEKEYDGTALTANGIKVEGLKGKDSVSAKTTGSRTKVGSSNNTYEINWKDTKKSNYKVTDVLGKLKVKPSNKAVTLTSGTASHAYSGHALTSDEIKAEGLPEGFTVKAKMDGAQTDTGSSKNTVKSYKILDAKGNDVTDMFANVTVKTGTLTVSPKKITVETEGATKVYDGEELTNKNGAIHGLVSGEHADVMTNGTQTNVGSSDNGYTIAWGTAKEGNYTIASDTLGKLVVMPQSVNPNDPSYHKLQVSNPADLTYDGQTHKWAPEVKDYTGTELKEGVDYTLAYDTDDFINAGSITVTVVGKGNYTGTVSRTYRIKPAPVSIKTESAARVYNGKALTAGGAITGLVNGETVDFRVIGSQTKVGHSANTYKLAWTGTAREANYTVDSIETGTLTVTESEDTVVVTTTGGTFTYDGKAHGATVAVSQLPEGYTVDGTPSSDATATDANGDGVKATVDHLVIRNAEGEDVTSKLNIKKVDGTIKVLPAELTVTTDSATKVYDGTALTAGATVTGLVGDEEATLEATGKQTQVGSSGNGYKLTFDKTAKDKNYKVVSENLGTLTVTKQSIVPSEPGTPSDNYKGVTVDDPKDAVYDGVEHKWAPVVKDAEGKTLVEGTDYVVSYDIDDFIDVATINVTITGKGNYAGTIAKSYRITKVPLHVVTGSATKVYDGQALTSATVTIDGLAKRDRIGVAVTGSQTNVGSSQNTYAIDWMQTSADNYELTDELGTLTVAAAPARPTTPTTPTTPATPTVPNPTPNSSDGGSTTTTTVPKGDDSSASNDQEQKEEKIFDAKNPLGKFDGKKDTCWVHWYMIVCAVATAAYGLFVGLRRDKHGRRLQNDLDKVLGDDETQE